MRIYFLTFHGQQKESIKEELVGGAFINCWVEANDINLAEKIARRKIIESNWIIINKEECYEINRENYLDNIGGLKYYDQALIDKWVLVFHTYPVEQ